MIYGIAHHSLIYLYDYLAAQCNTMEIPISKMAIIENHTSALPKKPILIFASFASLYKFRKELNNKKVIVFVVDCAPQLFGVENIQILDMNSIGELSYKFLPKSFNNNSFKAILRRLKLDKVEKQALDIKKFDVIPKLIHTVKNGMVLDKINGLIYNTADPRKREDIRQVVLNALTGLSTLPELQANLAKMYRKSTLGAKFSQELLDFLATDTGSNYIKALHKIATHAGKSPPNIEKIAQDHNVDTFEVKYLIKLYRKDKKPSNPALGEVSSTISRSPKVA